MAAGTCAYCGCDDEHGCTPIPCGWTDETRELCTTCKGAETIAEKIVEVFRRVAEAGSSRRLQLISAAWADLTFEHKQLLVMTCRATVEAVSESLLEGMEQDAVLATLELTAIGQFLMEKFPNDVSGNEPVSDIVFRLLAPSIGGRIVVPTSADVKALS